MKETEIVRIPISVGIRNKGQRQVAHAFAKTGGREFRTIGETGNLMWQATQKIKERIIHHYAAHTVPIPREVIFQFPLFDAAGDLMEEP